MKILMCGLLLGCAALAQNQGGRAGGAVNNGYGNVVFPGTGTPSIYSAVQVGPTYAGRVSSTVSGRGAGMGSERSGGAGSHQRHGSGMGAYPVLVPYAYPGAGYGYNEPPNVTVINQPAPVPAVIINQNYAPDRVTPVMREYSNEELPAPALYQAPIPSVPEGRALRESTPARHDKPTVFLIALKDGSIYSAYAYWLEGDTLYYVTTKHAQNKATLDLVDVPFSEQLNRERGLEFKAGWK